MASYELRILPSAAREIEALPLPDRKRIVQRIGELAADPRPRGATRLKGTDHLRVRVGRHRIVYRVQDRELIVLVVKVGDRRDVYR